MPDPQPTHEELPEDGGRESKTYQAAGKLRGKRALITGGDSGIGSATAILFAREGADCTITYLPEEEEDAQSTRKRVEDLGQVCHLISRDLVDRQACREVVDFAVDKMGGIDILFNNAACRPCKMLSFHRGQEPLLTSPQSRPSSRTLPTCPRTSGSTPSTSTYTPSST